MGLETKFLQISSAIPCSAMRQSHVPSCKLLFKYAYTIGSGNLRRFRLASNIVRRKHRNVNHGQTRETNSYWLKIQINVFKPVMFGLTMVRRQRKLPEVSASGSQICQLHVPSCVYTTNSYSNILRHSGSKIGKFFH